MTTSSQRSTVKIHGYEEHFAFNPIVKILKNGMPLGEVGHHQTFEVEIDEDCNFEFKCHIRSTAARVRNGVDTHVLLAFNRFSGTLSATTANDHNLEELRRVKKANAKNAIIRSVLLVLVMGIAWLVVKTM